MSENSQDYLISTCFDFGGRSISVTVEHDGFSYWLDETSSRQLIQQTGKSGLDVLMGDENAASLISQIDHEHTFQVPVPEAGLKVIRQELSPNYWADIFPEGCGERLDAILEPLFWEHVNPHLSPPCSRQ
jgi:hypothetical protein